MNAIAVVIVTYQGKDWIRPLLHSILTNSMQASIIVIDNASSDGTGDIVRDEFPSVILIELNENVGFGAGNNLGIAHAMNAGFEYIYLANQDGFVPPDSIKSLYDFMTANQACGVATPLHCSPDLEHIDHKTYTGYLSSYAYDYLSDAALGNVLKDGYRIRGINAAAWFVRAEVFKKVGGFDPIFFMYGEDDDLIARFEHHEVSFALVPSARFLHYRQSPGGRPKTRSVQLRRETAQAFSMLLARTKRPGTSFSYALSLILSMGVTRPIADFILRRKLIPLTASLLASFKLVFRLRQVFRHKRICEEVGPHFLDLTCSETQKLHHSS